MTFELKFRNRTLYFLNSISFVDVWRKEREAFKFYRDVCWLFPKEMPVHSDAAKFFNRQKNFVEKEILRQKILYVEMFRILNKSDLEKFRIKLRWILDDS